jgi:Flp pilus assembly pilin Flp
METGTGRARYTEGFTQRLLRIFRGASRGAGYVEYILIMGLGAIAVIVAFQRFRAIQNVKARNQAKTVVAMDSPRPEDVIAALGGYDEYRDTIDCQGGVCTWPGQCFAAGTLVHTEDGDRPIESIGLGERVWSRNETTGLVGLHTVTRLLVTRERYVIDLKLGHDALQSETITVTPNHPFWVEGRGWTAAEELATDAAWSPEGPLSASSTYGRTDPITVYNLEVEGDHTYFIGRSHALVHNAGGVGGAPAVCPGGGGGGAASEPAPSWTPNPRADRLWAKGKLKEHFDKHKDEVGATTKEQYTQMAIDFATAPNDGSGRFIDYQNGPFFYRYEPSTGLIFIGTPSSGTIRTFYRWDGRADDAVIVMLQAAGKLPP